MVLDVGIDIGIATTAFCLLILVLILQKPFRNLCYWYWYCIWKGSFTVIDIGIACERVPYRYWYWYCKPAVSDTDMDIESDESYYWYRYCRNHFETDWAWSFRKNWRKSVMAFQCLDCDTMFSPYIDFVLDFSWSFRKKTGENLSWHSNA